MAKPLQTLLLGIALVCAQGVMAQSAAQPGATAPAAAPAVAASPAATPAAASDAAAATAAAPAAPAVAKAPQSASIFEVAPGSQAERVKTQPGNNAPMWRELNSGVPQVTTLPAREGGVLMQKGGMAWREFRNGQVTQKGGWALVGVLALIALFYLYRGPIKVSEPPTGRLIERFTVVERGVHWANAICFTVLGLSGLLMLFGKHLLLPVVGHTLFSWFAILSKNLHNFIGPLFAVTLVLMFLTFVRDNLPAGGDLSWLMKFGGLFKKHGGHVPSGRFNAGEKMMFWGGIVVLGIIVATTGFLMDFPGEQTRADLQSAWSWHSVAALVFVALIIGHIYIGSIGTEGALDAMKTGYVDESWAKEHHENWYNDVKTGKVPAERSKPAGALGNPSSNPAA